MPPYRGTFGRRKAKEGGLSILCCTLKGVLLKLSFLFFLPGQNSVVFMQNKVFNLWVRLQLLLERLKFERF